MSTSPQLFWIAMAYAIVVGLVVGSYLNVVVYRLPRGMSTVRPRSRCPGGGEPVLARDNIPVLSYLLLKGRCRQCGLGISARYPAVEALTGVLFGACFLTFGFTLATPIAMLFVFLMLSLALIDAEHFILPDRLTYPGMVLGLLLSFWSPLVTPLGSLFGIVLGAGSLLLLIGVWYLIRRQMGMGLGDPKMLAAIGSFLGVGGVVVTLFLSSILGSIVGAALLARGSGDLQSKLPFGVFLAVASLIALFVGPQLVSSYLQLL
ncbi:MAG: prepilin peptidase [Acidobacteriota bacterium]